MNQRIEHIPRVSVVVTVYNVEAYLEETLESVQAQTMRDFELIIVNDGATDRSGDICKEFSALDSRVCLIEQDNAGIAVAANAGVAACRAALIARLDADDLMEPTRLEKQAAFMDANPGVVCCGSDVALIDGQGRFLTVEKRPSDDQTIQDQLLRGHCAIANPSCMIRAEALRQAGPYDESYAPAEDFEMFLRLGELGELRNIDEPLTRYRLHNNSASAQRGKVQRENCRRACELAWQRRGENRPFEGGELWRPTAARSSRLEYALRYGWWAWMSGELKTSASYGLDALWLCPWSKEAWMLWSKSVMGVKPTGNERPVKAAWREKTGNAEPADYLKASEASGETTKAEGCAA